MTTRKILIAAVAATAVSAPALAQGAATQPARPAISLSQAVATVESQLGARAYDAEFDIDRRGAVYEVSVVKDGRAIEAWVDASTGKLLGQSRNLKAAMPFLGDRLKTAQTAPRTLAQTIAAVETATKGKVSEIGLERRAGRDYYEVELVGAQDRDVLVDVRTGAITPLLDD